MELSDILEPILITYNRKELLKRKLNQLVAEDSPIKDCEIKILDNASDDGTCELCKEFCQNHTNFTYYQNHKNLGLAGNIIKAMELASKKWLWIICDDDDFHWRNWDEVEPALYQDYDIVFTGHVFVKNELPYQINSAAFLSHVIYNTKNITDTVMINAYGIAHTLCPHHAIFTHVINKNGKIFTPPKGCEILTAGNNDIIEKDYSKATNPDLYYKFAHYNILQGYINAYSLIKDNTIRHQCIDVLCQGSPFKQSMHLFLKLNPDGDLNQIFEVLINANSKQRKDLIDVILSNKSIIRDKYTKFIFANIILAIKYFFINLRKKIICIHFHDKDTIVDILGAKIKIPQRSKYVNK